MSAAAGGVIDRIVEKTVNQFADLLIGLRDLWSVIFAAMTLFFAYSATHVQLDPGFLKLIPVQHEYMRTMMYYMKDFSGANTLLVNLRWKGDGDIYNPEFMKAMQEATDEVFFIPGINRTKVSSIFTPNTIYLEITEDGFNGEPVVPARFSATPEELAKVRHNVGLSGQIGLIVANDGKSALIRADLQDFDPNAPVDKQRVDYWEVQKKLEDIRHKFERGNVEVNIIGFARLLGDVIYGLIGVFAFFGLAFTITVALLFWYTRSVKMTVTAVIVALLPVLWLIGILPLIGFGIDPMSILVPFLIFSIGVSHAVQMTNAWRQEVCSGASSITAAHSAFRKLFVPGAVALLTNALGFAVIMFIDIPIVHELGITACLGVLLMIITNKMILPIILSHVTLEASSWKKSTRSDSPRMAKMWRGIARCADPRYSLWVFGACLLLLGVSTVLSRGLVIGDTGRGAPELRADSRYNYDDRVINDSYNIGTDVLTVIVEAPDFQGDSCLQYPVINLVDRFELFLHGVAGVQSVTSAAGIGKLVISSFNEGNPRMRALPRSEVGLSTGSRGFDPNLGINNESCRAIQVMIFMKNHEGATIAHVISEIKRFIALNPTAGVKLRLASGNVGVMAATNEAVSAAEVRMLLAIFGALTLLCLITFRSWRAVLCVIAPLAIVSIFCNALMATLGIGLKVATLPVIALGVGVGVDYGIYLFERIQHHMRDEGVSFCAAFENAMRERGSAAVFTAITMAVAVGTWTLSALKFQADMGLLLSFMFLVNMLGAICLLPAMGSWLFRASGGKPVQPVVPAEPARSFS
ncbi:MAG: family transporter [Hydrocarboniphaga sp.]|uniref:efflux RND transporter permease subunit n=1 Tax=Hydrocarboniphaga sp. TaxID=2033016 RepID=UPI002606B427|nr:efflux RND transporter permease subunit [Hydrocarboniphaga sp.]MDB5967750.1 family transporter [Hydrocarboniphaga sp.]